MRQENGQMRVRNRSNAMDKTVVTGVRCARRKAARRRVEQKFLPANQTEADKVWLVYEQMSVSH